MENQNGLRGMRVRELLAANKKVDVDAATEAIRYPLRWHHVGLVLWYADAGTGGDELSRLQSFLREMAEAVGAAASPLFIPADQGCAWRWLPYRAAVADVVARVRGSRRRDRTCRAWRSEAWLPASRDSGVRTGRRMRPVPLPS